MAILGFLKNKGIAGETTKKRSQRNTRVKCVHNTEGTLERTAANKQLQAELSQTRMGDARKAALRPSRYTMNKITGF